ncbi:MAG: potassium transporter Kup [Candidatus Aminicenantes bacterium]|nr:potassium transporter Kup [Candidatus Aminicenantes bacterium]
MLTLNSRLFNNPNFSPSDPESNHRSVKNTTFMLIVGALGVVFGDIGTSPLYTLKECFHGDHAIALTETNIYGVMSLIFWSLTIVVSIKYVTFVLLADNHGEGGIFALLGLVSDEAKKMSPRTRACAIGAGILGAGLLCGEGVITPAISVLSAVEGLEVATRAATPVVLPLTCTILFLLFFLQHRGTADIGKVFGPVMAIWFGFIATFGIAEMFQHPQVLRSLHPIYAYEFFAVNKLHSIVVFGSVVLCLTGCEALYADLGHFGIKAIRLSWSCLVFPALLCNYFGQGALLLSHPELAFHPFYGLVPKPLLYPMVVLATAATVIASQALISGVFSLAQQAIDLGFFPRLRIVHTSYEIKGQIYVPVVNYSLMIACLGVVIGFGESSRLAGAYGIAVTGTMNITSVLFFILITRRWGWSLWKAVPLVALFLIFDMSYFLANLLKILDGGWFTLLTAILLTIFMTTWRKGRAEVVQRVGTRLPLKLFLEDVARHNIPRVQGTAVFMSIHPEGTSPVLLHHLKHTKILYERVVLLSILSGNIPIVSAKERVRIDDLGEGFYQIVAYNGYMQRPNVPAILKLAEKFGLHINPAETTFYLGRVTFLTTGESKMMRWRKGLFAIMSRIAGSPTVYFGLPANRVVELGAQIQL